MFVPEGYLVTPSQVASRNPVPPGMEQLQDLEPFDPEGTLFGVYGRVRMEGMKGEGEALIVDDVFEAVRSATLDDHVSDVASLLDRWRVQRGTLTLLPGDYEIAHFDSTAILQELQGPGLFADGNDPGEGRNALDRGSMEKEWPLGPVVADIWVSPIGPSPRIRRCEHPPHGKARSEALDGFDPRGQIFELRPEKLPTMQSPPNCCHQLSVSRSYITRSELRSLPVVPKVRIRPAARRSNTTEELHSGHQVIAMGIPPTVSFTISCQIMIRSG